MLDIHDSEKGLLANQCLFPGKGTVGFTQGRLSSGGQASAILIRELRLSEDHPHGPENGNGTDRPRPHPPTHLVSDWVEERVRRGRLTAWQPRIAHLYLPSGPPRSRGHGDNCPFRGRRRGKSLSLFNLPRAQLSEAAETPLKTSAQSVPPFPRQTAHPLPAPSPRSAAGRTAQSR